MNAQPAQPISRNGQQPDPDQSTIPTDAAQLAHIAELLDILDGFPGHADYIADRLADYLHATGRNHPQHPDRYDANLLIDQASFTAHSLRGHRRQPNGSRSASPFDS
jgi:hypothetical protein